MAKTRRRRELDCDFCPKTFRAATTEQARAKRLVHVIQSHGKQDSKVEGEVDPKFLEVAADILAPEDPETVVARQEEITGLDRMEIAEIIEGATE